MLGRILATFYMALFLTFMVAPIFFVVVNSFNAASYSVFPPPGFSLRWYYNLFTIDSFFLALRNSLVIALCASLTAVLIGAMAALAITRGKWRFRSQIHSFFLAPLTIPKIVIGVTMFMLAIRLGVYPSRVSVILAYVVILLPFAVSIIVAGLAQVDRIQEEAARDLGAGPIRVFYHATVPQLRGVLVVALVFTFNMAFDEFDIALFLTRSENITLPVRMYHYMHNQEDPTLAAMSALIILASLAVLMLAVLISPKINLMRIFGRGNR